MLSETRICVSLTAEAASIMARFRIQQSILQIIRRKKVSGYACAGLARVTLCRSSRGVYGRSVGMNGRYCKYSTYSSCRFPRSVCGMAFAMRSLTWLLYSTPPAVRRRSTVAMSSVHFSCPHCQSDLLPIADNPHGLRCENGHFTNLAKEGYVFMMKPTKKNAEKDAQSDARTRAARAFYEAGGFAAQADAVAGEVLRALSLCPPVADGEPLHVLNAGCGEGLCLRRLEQRMAQLSGQHSRLASSVLWGTDQNKLAVRYASKRQRSARFAVCSPHQLPFADGCFSVVFAVSAPSPWDEFCRVLRPGGVVIVARPGNRHLSELRTQLLRDSTGAPVPGSEPPKQFSAGLAENYLRVSTEEQLGGSMAEHLLAMTPWAKLGGRRHCSRSCSRKVEVAATATARTTGK